MKRIINILPIFIIVLTAITPMIAQQRVYQAPEFAQNWSKPGLHPDHINLTFAEDPATSISVTWRTSPEVTEGYAEIALADAAPKFWRRAITQKAITETMDASQVLTAEVISNYHSVTFTGLIPDTLYAYRVGNGKIWSEWIQFRTAAKEPKPFSFLYVGDAQNYILELWSRLIREGYRKTPDARFIIHAGDLVSTAHSERQWHEWFTAGGWIHSMLPSIPVIGNHEYEPYNAEEAEKDIQHLSVQWRPQFALPLNGPDSLQEMTYYFDYQGARIIVLTSSEQREEQVAWLEQVLSNNPNKWTIVSFHHPLFSASEGRNNEKLRNLWKPIFDKYKVDLALQGHDHSYARGRAGEHTENIVGGLNTLDTTGTVYVVSVSGGKMYRLRPNGWEDFGAERERGAENTQLFQVIQINGDTLSFEAYTATGALYDAFDLIKNPTGGANKFVERKQEAIAERFHHNTISYEDELPESIQADLEKKYPDYFFNRITYIKNEEFHGYNVQLRKDKIQIQLKLNDKGEILEEVVQER